MVERATRHQRSAGRIEHRHPAYHIPLFNYRVLFASVLFSACTIGEINVPKTTSFLVVHGVLNTAAGDQVVLLERSLTGAVDIPDTNFNPGEPILSDGGLPVSGATAEIISPTGQVVPGIEDRTVTTNGTGAGVYRFRLRGSALLRGQSYRLHMRTREGEELTAVTTVPDAPTASSLPTVPFNRTRDTLILTWPEARSTRSYAVRIESPFGPFFLFTDSLHLRVTGELRNLFADDLPRVLIPGFEQGVLVAAVDSNFYDYYRTQNDPFTGSGIISRVQGGVGFFGALAPVWRQALDVTAMRQQPIEGRFVYLTPAGEAGRPPALDFVLYVESPAPRNDVPAALSGKYTTPLLRTDGLLGGQTGNTVMLALLANQSAYDTVTTFTGELRGDTLAGTFKDRPGPAVFVRRP